VLREILAKPRILQRITDIGLEAQRSAPEEFAERIRADVKLWAAITKEAGIGRP
jgi:tripartite-type tricarboxylate transporter receptor subunit TctC